MRGSSRGSESGNTENRNALTPQIKPRHVPPHVDHKTIGALEMSLTWLVLRISCVEVQEIEVETSREVGNNGWSYFPLTAKSRGC